MCVSPLKEQNLSSCNFVLVQFFQGVRRGVPIGRDGAADCADTDCADDVACSGGENEVCGNKADDDDDGIADCASPDCAAALIYSNVGLSGAGCLLSPGASEAGKVSATVLFSLLLAGLALLRKRA
jgi:hypothetical protein